MPEIRGTNTAHIGWLGSLVVRKLDLQLDGLEFDSWLSWLVLGWVIIFRWTNDLSISPRHQAPPIHA